MTKEKVDYSEKGKTWAVLRIVAKPKLGTKHKEYVRDCLIFYTETILNFVFRIKLIMYLKQFLNFCKFCLQSVKSPL